MKNSDLINDYLRRCDARLKAVEVLFQEESYADVVRESQEIVELSLKALLRGINVSVPHIHDVGDILLENSKLLKNVRAAELEEITEISRRLRRDRELSFYGSEDLTPSTYYRKKDATEAKNGAKKVVVFCKGLLK
jgi:HEPN domain-containing protein